MKTPSELAEEIMEYYEVERGSHASRMIDVAIRACNQEWMDKKNPYDTVRQMAADNAVAKALTHLISENAIKRRNAEILKAIQRAKAKVPEGKTITMAIIRTSE